MLSSIYRISPWISNIVTSDRIDMRVEILEKDIANMDQIDKDTAEFSDITIVPDDEQRNSQQFLTILVI